MGVENSFISIQHSIINSSKLEPFHCSIVDIEKSDILDDSFKLKIETSKETNDEFLVKRDLLKKQLVEKEKDVNNNNINFKNGNDILSYFKKKLINCDITIEKVRGFVVKEQLYCHILNFRIRGKIMKKKEKIEKTEFHFIHSNYIDNISLLYVENRETLFSIYLYSSGQKSKDAYEYRDSSKNNILMIKQTEPSHIYFFSYLYYDPKNKKIRYIDNISGVEDINSPLNTDSKVFEINKKGNRIIKGKIKEAKFSENIIEVEVEENSLNSVNKKLIIIQLNNNLIKNISFNGICYFMNFQFNEDNKYSFKNFSHIIIEEKTIIKITFLDFKKEKKYYINAETLIIELKNVQDKNYYREQLIYMKNDKQKHFFIVEIYIGRVNAFYSYLNLQNDGFCYEFLYIFKKEGFKIYQTIMLDEEQKNVTHFNNIEKFDNKFKGRLCIINIPKQRIKILDENIKPEGNSFKYLYLYQENYKTTIELFEMKQNKNDKMPFSIDKEYEIQLNIFYNNEKKFIGNINIIYEKKYNLLFDKEKEYVKT